jgi:hypothetical protein
MTNPSEIAPKQPRILGALSTLNDAKVMVLMQCEGIAYAKINGSLVATTALKMPFLTNQGDMLVWTEYGFALLDWHEEYMTVRGGTGGYLIIATCDKCKARESIKLGCSTLPDLLSLLSAMTFRCSRCRSVLTTDTAAVRHTKEILKAMGKQCPVIP